MKLQDMKWQLYNFKKKQLLLFGLRHGLIHIYDEELIQKLRTIYYGGIPASIILLTHGLSNGYCYERALLLARAFLDDEDDIQLIYANISSFQLNPGLDHDNPLDDEHCILERTTSDGKHLIYDTSRGIVFDKNLYWRIECPKINKIEDKETIRKSAENEDLQESFEQTKYAATMILPFIEKVIDDPKEMYARPGLALLQREIEYYKDSIDYTSMERALNQEIKKAKLR